MARRIGGLFGRSVFGPLYEHLVSVVKTAQLLRPLGQRVVAGDRSGVQATARQIDVEEGVADEVKEEIRRQLSTSMFSAVERSDTLIALGVQDDVADRANDTGKLLAVRNTVLPATLRPVFLDFTEAVVRTAEVLLARSQALQELLEGAHDRARLRGEVERLAEVRQAQFHADQEYQRFLAQLFSCEPETDPVTVVILMHIANRLKSVADSAENVAECLERMVAHQ